MFKNEFTHNNMRMKFAKGDKSQYKMYRFEPKDLLSGDRNKGGFAPFQLRTSTDTAASMDGCGSTCPNCGSNCTDVRETKDGLVLTYLEHAGELEVTVNMSFYDGADVVRQVNTVKNIGKNNITLTHFSSALVTGICAGGLMPWYDDRKITVHYCQSHWQGEAQWVTDTLDKLGVYPQTAHSWDATSCRFTSTGSWSTGKYYPLVMLEDNECGKVWYMEIEGGHNWTLEIGNKNGENKGFLFMEGTCADEDTLSFTLELKPGESYTAAPCIFGCTDGRFEDGVHELLKYKRMTTLAGWDTPYAPACFNDYMDCLWGGANREKLVPMIDAAAKAGIELFCMDAGWYTVGNGTWSVNDELYGEGGLRGIVEYIRSKGMIAGIWLEIESCFRNTALYKDELLLKRNGTVLNPDRANADFTKKEVREYLMGVFDMMYEMGIRFVKNDYNLSTMVGAEVDGLHGAAGLQKATNAFYDFIDEVQNKYPDLKIENCGSGAMRSDNGTLSHFNLQSTSDQEFYELNPSIVSGTLAFLAPEKAGIWAYPYPISFYESCDKKAVWEDKDYKAQMADGEQTVFNMVTALCGTLYMSGRIEHADRNNFALIKEGVKAFKKYRKHIASSHPVYPCGHFRMSDNTYTALGLMSENNKKLTLAVWRRKSKDDILTIDLSRYTTAKTTVKMVYPSDPMGAEFMFNPTSGILTVKLPKMNSARYFEINI